MKLKEEILTQIPKTITLCGSTRFKSQFEELNKQLTLSGRVVLTVAFFQHSDNESLTGEQKKLLDSIHFKKIDLAEAIVVIDVNEYIGASTSNEIKYAQKTGKLVFYLSKIIQ